MCEEEKKAIECIKEDMNYAEEDDYMLVSTEIYYLKIVLNLIDRLQKELENNKNDIKDAKDILGNYKHLSFPDVEETREQEEIVDKCFCKLNEILDKE